MELSLDLLRQRFAALLRAERFLRRLRRRALVGPTARDAAAREMQPAVVSDLLAAAASDVPELLQRLGSSLDGLSETQSAAIRAAVGANEIEHEKPLRWWTHLWLCYRTPFGLLLSVLAVVSLLTEDVKATVVIGTMVVLSTLVRFWQEARSNRAAEKLKAMVRTTATVLRPRPADDAAPATAPVLDARVPARPARRVELPIRLLVPGDVIALSAGDMIPADCRVTSAKDLFVSQAAMTGEAMPVEKCAERRMAATAGVLELDNLVFMGTNVVSGAATAVVVATGGRTCFGALAERVTTAGRMPTQFDAGVNKVSSLLIRFMAVMAPAVLLLNGLTKHDWFEALLFALAVAVGLTPEMLPMIVTSTLAKGAVALARRKVIVKRLDAIQTFGAMDVLCTDKTGTLTQDRVVLERHTDVWGEASDAVLEFAYLNSFYQTGLKNLLDLAVLEHLEVPRALGVATAFRKVDEIPFDFQRRRMSVVVADHEARHVLICKGAVEEMLAVSRAARHGARDEPLTPDLLARIRAVTASLNETGLRVVAVAINELPPTRDTYSVADETGLTLIGYVAFLDPPKETTAPALQALAAHGVAVKVLTGDNELVTTQVCRQVGLDVRGVLLGVDVERLDDAGLARVAEAHNVFARLTPAHKERIVRMLRENGHVVGFLGDGINDAAALRTADIGISVDAGVDIAREAADIILLEKSLLVLEEGVIEGRKTFVNMLKYLKMTASSNFGNVFSVLIASALLPFLPMLPLQLLVQNLLYDASQIAIPFDHVEPELLAAPRRWNAADLGRFMLFFGPISSVFDVTTFAVMWHVFGANRVESQALFQSGWFVVGLVTQTLVVHAIRTPRLPFVESRAAWPLVATSVAVVSIGVLLPMGPLAHAFRFQPLPPGFFPVLALIVLAYLGLAQAMKGFYMRRFGSVI